MNKASTLPTGPIGPVKHGLVARSDVGIAANTRRAIQLRALPRIKEQPRRVGIISNVHSHRNRTGALGWGAAKGKAWDILYRAPRTLPDLSLALLDFAEAGVDLLIVDGGDGTVRDVITCASSIFPNGLPRVAVVPSGKTNALALDLGIPADWTMHDALEAARNGTIRERAPIEILRPGSTIPDLRGFLFGAGAFVLATGLAQRTHKAGAFNGLAVGLSLGWGVAQTLFGPSDNVWRAGEEVHVSVCGRGETTRRFYMLFGSTLERLPLDLKPFGALKEGLKILAIDAPPTKILRAVPQLLSGSEAPWLDEAGYHRGAFDSLDLSLKRGFILDGELYAGGELTVRRGEPIRFVVP